MPITTAEELLKAQNIGRCELVRGELRMMVPPGFEHCRIALRIARRLDEYSEPRGLGVVVGEPGFLLATKPDTVRAPDAAFVRAERVKGTIRGYFPGAPDLAVEVLSPDDRAGEVRRKVAEWLQAGALAVWVVDPKRRTVTVHESGRPPVRLGATEVLRGGNALPGFEIPVGEIFA